jgi:hypothetical protein
MAIPQQTMKILGTLVLGKDHAFDWHAKSFALDRLKMVLLISLSTTLDRTIGLVQTKKPKREFNSPPLSLPYVQVVAVRGVESEQRVPAVQHTI